MFFGALRPAECGIASPFTSDWFFSLLVSEANASTLLFLDRMVLAVNGFMILNGQRRTMF
jgi:hypothetical protein